jgi:hypothetical protein
MIHFQIRLKKCIIFYFYYLIHYDILLIHVLCTKGFDIKLTII